MECEHMRGWGYLCPMLLAFVKLTEDHNMCFEFSCAAFFLHDFHPPADPKPAAPDQPLPENP